MNGTYQRPNFIGAFLFHDCQRRGIIYEKRYDQKGDHQHQQEVYYMLQGIKHPTDMNKPFVAICNSYIDIVPGHVHLRELADIAKSYSRSGAIPFEFNTIGVDDGIAMGHIECAFSSITRNHCRCC